MNPVLREEDATGRVASTPPGTLSYAIYADDVEIAGVRGIPGAVTLVFRGNPDREIFLPENFVELIRTANPAKTKSWSDKKIIKRASAVSRVGLKDGNVIDFNLEDLQIRVFRASIRKHLDNAYAYRLALQMKTELVLEANIVLDDVSTTFRYYPYPISDLRDRQGTRVVAPAAAFSARPGAEHPHRHLRRLGQPSKLQITDMPLRCQGVQMRRRDRRYQFDSVDRISTCVYHWPWSARTGGIRGGVYTIERTTGSAWPPEIMAFVKQHHSNSAVRSIDNAALISSVARVSKAITAQLNTVRGHQLR